MIVVTNPFDPHWGRPGPGGVGYSLLYPDPDWLRSLCGREPKHFERPVIDDPALGGRLASAFELAASRGEEGLLRDCVGLLFRRYARLVPPPAATRDDRTERPRDHIAADAAAAGLSRSHYTRRFRERTGLSPIDHRRQARVIAARTMIEAGAALADAAADAGFSDQAHMTRQFRRILGVTPRAYQPHR
jgi:AraC-like DNA-binding protein